MRVNTNLYISVLKLYASWVVLVITWKLNAFFIFLKVFLLLCDFAAGVYLQVLHFETERLACKI